MYTKLNSVLLRRLKFLYRRTPICRCHTNDFWKIDKPIEVDVPLSRQPLKFQFGHRARFADGSCTAQLGDTTVLVVTGAKEKSLAGSFVPLTVNYRQKASAAGRIPTNYLKRERGPTEREVLTSRVIDRSIRPLFPKGFFSHDVQLDCNLCAVDGFNDPDVIAINAASAALSLSDIPWDGPVGAVRVGLVDNEIIINPLRKEISKSSLNLVLAATEYQQVVMLEASADNIVQQDFMRALEAGVKETQQIIDSIKDIQKRYGKTKISMNAILEPSEEILDATKLLLEAKAVELLTNYNLLKVSRGIEAEKLQKETAEKLKENYPDIDPSLFYASINIVFKNVFRNLILETGLRCDGRGLEDIRNIKCELDVYKPLHGSSVFQRGQTQVFCTVTFDSLESAFRADAVSVMTGEMKEKNFMLHYEFPGFATNDIGRSTALGRREYGHGALAEKSLRPVIPSNFPFTIRLTAEVLESNGSSSMAAVCGGSLALMDAGVPISEPMAGVAMGLISVPNPEKPHEICDYKVLTDILGLEDYMGDMDFKIAGSKSGLSAVQLDVKIPGLPLSIISEAIQQSFGARREILNIMNKTISKTREEKKDNWPVSETLDLPPHKRARFFGVGGYNIKKLQNDTGVQISEIGNNELSVFAPNSDAMAEAKEIIDRLLEEEKEPDLQMGAIYSAKVMELRDYGVMVILYPNMKPVLLSNLHLDKKKVYHPSALGVKVGDELKVKFFGRDPVSGAMRLSRTALQVDSQQAEVKLNFFSDDLTKRSSSSNSNS